MLPSTNKVVDENLPLWASFFLSAINYGRHALNFFYPKKSRQTKAGQDKQYDITKSLGFVQVC